MRHRKTHKRKYNLKKKTLRRKTIRRKSIRRKSISRKYKNKKGGVGLNINNQNNVFDDRRSDLINRLQDIILEINDEMEHVHPENQRDPQDYIDEIRGLRQEAQEIDNYYENDDMQQQLIQRIQEVHNIYGMNYINGNNNNNNETITIPNNNRMNSNNEMSGSNEINNNSNL